MSDQWYDASSKTMWVTSDADGDTLVPHEELERWVQIKKQRATPEGQPVEHVNYVFRHRDGAEYNHQALAFTGLGTFVGDRDRQERFDNDETPSFGTRADFGIDD